MDNRPNLLAILAPLDATPRGSFDVRITVGGRVLDIDSRYVKAHDALTSALMLGKRAVTAPAPAHASPEYEAPPMDFIPAEEPLVGDSGKSDNAPVFEMERAADKPKRTIVDESIADEDELSVPTWLDGATGLASAHRGAVEGW